MTLEWRTTIERVPYTEAVSWMENRVSQIHAGTRPECIWLLEHPPLYTAGTRTQPEDRHHITQLPVYPTGRGGQLTYHGPGQRIAYVMVDLKRRQPDLRQYISCLEEWLIQALQLLGVVAQRCPHGIGVWIRHQDGTEDKIAAIGVRVRRWVTYHGIALNVAPDLTHYQGIVPCGIRDHGVTSLAELGYMFSMSEVDLALQTAWTQVPFFSDKFT